MNRIQKTLLILFLTPLFVVLVILCSPVIGFLVIKDWYERQKFLRANSKCHFLICTTKHGWEPFLKNNVLPVLPEKIKVHWVPRRQHLMIHVIDRLLPRGKKKPYLIHFRKQWASASYSKSAHSLSHVEETALSRRTRSPWGRKTQMYPVRSLHDELLKYKGFTSMDLQLQIQMRELLTKVSAELDEITELVE